MLMDARLSLGIILLGSSLLATEARAQAVFKILHYTETSGYDHNTRQVSLSMFQNLGLSHGFAVDDDSDGSSFDSLSTLQQYAVVVFCNTSGDNILTASQRANFESYINGGGSYVGIHAASDTYRHSTADGSNTGAWDWYAELLGASVQQYPYYHVIGTPLYELSKIGTHPSTDSLPDPWAKNEEYYYWENGYYNADNVAVLEVEETIGPNGQVNSYDSIRPMSWYRHLPGGGRSFYTALGHASSNYTSDQYFISHVRDAVLWAAKVSIGGAIVTPDSQSVRTATVSLSGHDSMAVTTGIDGSYAFDIIKGGSYTVAPSKSNDLNITNGISAADIALIRAHILGNQKLSTPYKIIAADVNGSGTVSSADILQIHKLILGISPTFPGGRLWEFVRSDYVFSNPDVPFPADSSRTYSNISSNQAGQNFIGIKLGDVNDSWDAGTP
jgi:type 1 glutamine amidotransferase